MKSRAAAPILACFLSASALAQTIGGNPHAKRDALLGGITTEINQGTTHKAIDDLEEAEQLGLTRRQKKLWLPVMADLYVRLNRYDKAFPILHAALDADPGNWRRHLALGLACYQVGLTDEAISSLVNTTQLKPDSADALLPLGKLYLKKGLLDHARQCLRKLLLLEPKSLEGWLSLAEVDEKGGQPSKAVEELKNAALLNSDSRIYFKIGLLYAYQKQTDSSLDAYKKGQALEPRNGDYDFYAGLTYWLQEDWAKTEKHMTQAIEKGYTGGLPYFFRSLAYYHQGLLSAAHDDAARAKSMAQGNFLANLSEDIIHGT
jgi:tetratricopeptide (TPR) repeat protein